MCVCVCVWCTVQNETESHSEQLMMANEPKHVGAVLCKF